VASAGYAKDVVLVVAAIFLSYQSRSRMTDQLLFECLESSDFLVDRIPHDEYHPEYTIDKITIYKLTRRGTPA